MFALMKQLQHAEAESIEQGDRLLDTVEQLGGVYSI